MHNLQYNFITLSLLSLYHVTCSANAGFCLLACRALMETRNNSTFAPVVYIDLSPWQAQQCASVLLSNVGHKRAH